MNNYRAVLRLSVLFLAWSAGPVLAADWSFDPVINLTAEHNNNVQFAGAAGVSDDFLTASVALVFTARTPRSTTTFSYIPTQEWYQDNDHLNNLAHTAALTWAHTTSSRTTWDASVVWSRRERPYFSFLTPEADLIVTPRTETTTQAARLGVRFAVAPRSRLFLAGTYAATSFDTDILETGDGDILLVDDVTETGLEAGFEWDHSPMTVMRVFYHGTLMDEGIRGRRVIHRALYGLTHGPETGWQWDLSVGPAKIDVQELPVGESDETAGTQWVGDLSVHRPILRTGGLILGVSRDFTGNGGVLGSARTWAGYGSVRIPTGRWSALNLLGRYASRSPLEGLSAFSRAVTRTWRAEWLAAFGPHWGVVVFGEQVSQSAVGDSGLRSGYKIYGIGLRWTPNAQGAPRV